MALSMSCGFSLWKWASTTAVLRARICSEVRAVDVTEAPRVARCGVRDGNAAAGPREGAQVEWSSTWARLEESVADLVRRPGDPADPDDGTAGTTPRA